MPAMILSTLFALSLNTAAADDAAAVFARHRSAAIAPGIHRFENYVFATASEPIGRLTDSIARSKAGLAAAQLFVEEAIGDATRCTDNDLLRAQLANAARSVIQVKFSAVGLETLHHERQGANYIVVQSVPASRLEGEEVSCDVLLSKLSEAACASDAPLALIFLMLEIGSDDQRAALSNAARSTLAREYPALKAAVLGTPWLRAPAGYQRDFARTPPGGVEEALRVADGCPGHAALVEDARQAVRAAGYSRAAELIALPKRAIVELELDKRMQLRAELDQLRLKESGIATAMPWLEVLCNIGAVNEMSSGPGVGSKEAVAAFQSTPPKLGACLAAALGVAAPTADSWNLAAVSLRELGSCRLSIEACRVALFAQPDHPYAAINELLAWRALDCRVEVQSGLDRLASKAPLNAWATAKASALRLWLAEPSSESKVDPTNQVAPSSSPKDAGKQVGSIGIGRVSSAARQTAIRSLALGTGSTRADSGQSLFASTPSVV